MHVGAQIDHDQYRPFALFAKQLGVRRRAARRDAPVDAARIVAGLVGPGFVELHAAAAKMRHVGTGLQRVDAQHIERDRPRRSVETNQPGLADADRRRVSRNVVEQRALRHSDAIQNALDDRVASDAVGLGLETQHHAMTQYVRRDGLDIFGPT